MDRRRESESSTSKNGAARRESVDSIGENGASSVTRSGSPVNNFLNGQSAPDVPLKKLPQPKIPSPQHSKSSTSSDSAIVLSARSPHKPPLSPIVIIINERQPSTSRAAVEADFRRFHISDEDRLRHKRDSEFVQPKPFTVAAGLLSHLRFFVGACPEPGLSQLVDLRRINSDGEFEEYEDQISHEGVRAQIAFQRASGDTINTSFTWIVGVIALVSITGAILAVCSLVTPSDDKPSDSSRYPDSHQ